MDEKELFLMRLMKKLAVGNGTDEEARIIDAMRVMDRKYYVKEEKIAYEDSAQIIGAGQTISQPSTVARMLQLAKIQPGDRVLEIGTGSGWNASLIAHLAKPGITKSIEKEEELLAKAQTRVLAIQKRLAGTGAIEDAQTFDYLEITGETLEELMQQEERFDKVISTAGIQKEQETAIIGIARKLLKEKGVMICPRRKGPMLIVSNHSQKPMVTYTEEEYVFVPLQLES